MVRQGIAELKKTVSMQDAKYSKPMAADVRQANTVYRMPSGGRGPRLLWLLCAEFSESMCADAPEDSALAEADPVRLRT